MLTLGGTDAHFRKTIQLVYWDRGRPDRNDRVARKSFV